MCSRRISRASVLQQRLKLFVTVFLADNGYLLELFRSKESQGKVERIITKAVSGTFPVPLFQQVVLDKVH